MTRRFETTLELNSGQTFAMAGLMQRESTGRTSRIPGLGDIPVLGALFRSVRYQESETELVVLATASVVEPVSTAASTFVLPGETHCVPNDWEMYFEGQIEGKGLACLSSEQAKWLQDTGLCQLRGPGAWARCSTPCAAAAPCPNGAAAPAACPSVTAAPSSGQPQMDNTSAAVSSAQPSGSTEAAPAAAVKEEPKSAGGTVEPTGGAEAAASGSQNQ